MPTIVLRAAASSTTGMPARCASRRTPRENPSGYIYDETENRSPGAAAEAVIRLALRIDMKGRCLFTVRTGTRLASSFRRFSGK